jgi:hypothetical protein
VWLVTLANDVYASADVADSRMQFVEGALIAARKV